MSGKMFPTEPDIFEHSNHHQIKPADSKIPVPSSPTPFRRHNSLRLKGEGGNNPHMMRRSHSREPGRGESGDKDIK